MESVAYESDLNLKATELRLGLPGTERNEEQTVLKGIKRPSLREDDDAETEPSPKAQIVGWPPIRSYRKNNFRPKKSDPECSGNYVKVSMDGAPYLRKIDIRVYKCYPDLLKALESMFKFNVGVYSEREGYKGSECMPTYEDKDGDLMLVGDVPWNMFMSSCKRLRIMKASEARGLGYGV